MVQSFFWQRVSTSDPYVTAADNCCLRSFVLAAEEERKVKEDSEEESPCDSD